jgi:hypothetical protein
MPNDEILCQMVDALHAVILFQFELIHTVAVGLYSGW